MVEPKVPAIYTSLAVVLKELGVAKNGQLPTNMGGKSYITAVDVSLEVKRLFTENHILILPVESLLRHESLVDAQGKVRFVVVVEGTYTLVSTKDGSTAIVAGVGDGTAVGTSVASNIASTNALKNALLRTFLITEQSVEDEAKDGAKEAPAPVQAKIAAAAKTAPAAAPATPVAPKPAALPTQEIIRRDWIESGKVTKELVNGLVTKAKQGGNEGDDVFKWVLKSLEANNA